MLSIRVYSTAANKYLNMLEMINVHVALVSLAKVLHPQGKIASSFFLGAFKTLQNDLINLDLKNHFKKVIFLKLNLLISKLSFHDEDISDWSSKESFS